MSVGVNQKYKKMKHLNYSDGKKFQNYVLSGTFLFALNLSARRV